MHFDLRRLLITSCLAFAFLTAVTTQTRVPVIWDDAALSDWATPIAALQVRPAHYKPADYYAVPAENLRTYPVYTRTRSRLDIGNRSRRKNPSHSSTCRRFERRATGSRQARVHFASSTAR
jgi:hypothetical protein